MILFHGPKLYCSGGEEEVVETKTEIKETNTAA